jgi:hypothetical protein
MKSLIKAVALAVVLAAPVVSFAQSNPSVSDDAKYPADIQAAEARVAAENGSTSGVGGAVSGSSDSGARAPAVSTFTGSRSIYAGH